MKPVEYQTDAAPERVWEVLADGWTLASWVVGASRVRAVDATWPAMGSRAHHSVGAWPVVLNDHTEVEACSTGEQLVLLAKIRPIGSAQVTIELHPRDGGTLLVMSEDIVSGPARLLPGIARQVALRTRNLEALRRLALLAERRTSP